ncbi:MAG: malonate--CoA ligase [Magnetovibrionaceae bacterium]
MSNPLYDALVSGQADHQKPFLVCQDGATWSFADFFGQAARFAHALGDLGLETGDRVAVQVEKTPEALALYIACAQGGFVFLPLNTAYTPDEVSYFVSDSGAKILVADDAKRTSLEPVAAQCGAKLETLNPDGSGSLKQAALGLESSYPTVDRSADDLAAFLYTSGTTGRSKGAMLTQRNLLSNAEALKDYWRFSEDDVLLHALPIFHTHGLFVASNVMLLAGGSMIFLPKFELDAMLANLPKATSMMGVPTFYTRLLGDERFTKERVSHFRLFVSGSAPLLADTHVEFEKRTGHRILERYGMTETNMNTSNPYDGERRAGTVGFPLPGVELKITDPETGASLATGEIGQIEVRGENVFKGYWGMPEKTKAELREDGFFITGDLGLVDQDGYVTIVGRNKDLIISGGYNIYPKELELILDEQAGVLESAVVGVPHPDFGETVLAILVPNAGQGPDLSAIEEAISSSVARFKQPRKYILEAELPRNTMGKVQKNVIRDRYKDLFA